MERKGIVVCIAVSSNRYDLPTFLLALISPLTDRRTCFVRYPLLSAWGNPRRKQILEMELIPSFARTTLDLGWGGALYCFNLFECV
jgi:hypothetical protein